MWEKYFRHKHKILVTGKDLSSVSRVFTGKEIETHTVSEYTCRKLETEPRYPASRPDFEYVLKLF